MPLGEGVSYNTIFRIALNMRASPLSARSTREPAGRTGGCEVSELFALLGQPHVLRILHLFGDGRPHRFTELQRALVLSPRTLSQRLRVLVDHGFLERRSFRETPPRVEYGPTAKTLELEAIFPPLVRWSHRHSLAEVPAVAVVGRASE